MELTQVQLNEMIDKLETAGCDIFNEETMEEFRALQPGDLSNHPRAPMWFSHYAIHVLKNRWLEVEPTIAKNAFYSCFYTICLIKGRFLEAENVIIKDSLL